MLQTQKLLKFFDKKACALLLVWAQLAFLCLASVHSHNHNTTLTQDTQISLSGCCADHCDEELSECALCQVIRTNHYFSLTDHYIGEQNNDATYFLVNDLSRFLQSYTLSPIRAPPVIA